MNVYLAFLGFGNFSVLISNMVIDIIHKNKSSLGSTIILKTVECPETTIFEDRWPSGKSEPSWSLRAWVQFLDVSGLG